MRVTDTAIKYRTSAVVLTLLITFGGAFSYVKLPKESSPSIEIPYIVITTLYAGASPSDIENLITQPIEREIKGLSGIDNIKSTSTEGVSSIVVEFTPDVSMDDANQKVRDKVDLAKPDLPQDAEEPIVSEIDISEFPVMVINLAADYPLARLKEVAEDLEDELESIPSVLEVDLVGGLEREVQVDVDLAKLQGYGLTFDDITKVIGQENTNIPGGKVDVDRLNYLIRVDGQFDEPRQVADVVVKTLGGQPVYIRDLADVRFGFKERASYARLRILRMEDEDGKLEEVNQQGYLQVISLNVKKRAGENILETSAAVRETLDKFAFPTGTRVLVTGDQSKEVKDLVKDLENNIISGLLFVVAVLLFFLGVRNSFLVGVAIPFSMCLTFLIFFAMGQTLNFIILFSLIIALGMLVDNAIVIVENIYRFLEEGHDHWEAARLATGEVGGAVVASTATTVAAFIPMLFWPGIIGEFMGYLPMTLIVTLSASLFVALIINPVVTGYFARVEGRHDHMSMKKPAKVIVTVATAVSFIVVLVENQTTALVLAGSVILIYPAHIYMMKPIADTFVEKGLPAIVAWYRGFLQWMLQRDYSVRWAMARNATGITGFAGGLGLAVIGGVVAAASSKEAAAVILLPAAVMVAVGLLGIVLHTFELLLVGGWKAMRLGLVFGAVTASVLGIMYLSPRPVEGQTILEMLVLPAVVVAFGLLGGLLRLTGRTLILTDNRAKLMNAVMGGLLSILAMFVLAPTGVEFFPDTDPNQIKVEVKARLGTNLEASNGTANEFQQRLDALLAEDPNTTVNMENILVGVGVGGDQAFGGGSSHPETSVITMNLVEYNDRNEPSRTTLEKIRDRLKGVPGVDITITKDQNGPPTGPPVNIEVSGPRFEQIVAISSELKAMLKGWADSGEIPGLVDVRDNLDTGRPELAVRIDRVRAAQFGLNTQQIASTIRTAVNGFEASKYRTGEDEYDITVRLRKADRDSLEAVKNLTIVHEGAQVPLVAVADFDVTSGLGSVTRKDAQRVVTVSGGAATGYNKEAILQQVQLKLKDYVSKLPAGYKLEYTGENKDQEESFSFLTTALFVGSALILMIMIAQFNSVTSPFIIMIAVALSLIGVLLGLLLTRTAFSLFTFIGIISLAGIVVNNAIVLIDYTMQLRDRGLAKTEAIVEAGATRLRPVLLTALTTVLGLIPLTFGINIDFVGLLTNLDPDFHIGSPSTQFWGPMGTAIISGLTFATFLTLVIVPVMYSLMDSVTVRVKDVFAHGPAPTHGDKG
ncbi:MAG: efflux RND transporter permease subunit [Deltaproteobacteria bacterium]|nr:efflux RND transporter permease subunit [Deltaproteobacteria bacterium]